MNYRPFLIAALVSTAGLFGASAQDSLSNASYDVSRELYKDVNAAFAEDWKAKTGKTVEITQTHAGSSKQARAVIDGLETDVVTLNQTTDIEALLKAGLVSEDWAKQFPNGASPYQSITAFVVRKGNPKGIKDWADLVRLDVKIALVNPQTGGNGRYTFLAAYAYALKANGGDKDKAKEFIAKFYKNAPVLDTGGRAATQTFAQRGIGDVLVTFESETALISKEFGEGKFEAVIPSISVLSDHPVAIINKVVDKRGSRDLAKAYLDFLFSDKGQELIAKNYYLPYSPAYRDQAGERFGQAELVNPVERWGSWSAISKEFFADGGLFEQVYTGGN
jgi:sulfate transport system substrate-binding protein